MKGGGKNMFKRNPVYQREIGTDARASRIFLMIVIFNVALAVVTFVMFYATFNGVSNMGEVDYSGLTELYTTMAYIEFGMVMLIIPATTAGAITGERERKTLDIMLVGNRHARTVVFGKFLSNMRLILVVMLSSIPVLFMVLVYGGIKFSNLLQLFTVIMLSGIYIGSMGIFCSSICKRTTSAIVMAYGLFVASTLITIAISYFSVKINSNANDMEDYFILFFNPIAPLVYLISGQIESIDGIIQLIFYGITQEHVTKEAGRWILYSGIVQFAVSMLMLNISALILNPLKFNYIRRLFKRGNDGRKNKEN